MSSFASPELVAAIIGALATIIVGIAVVLISQYYNRKLASEEAHRLKKVELYKSFIDIVAKMLASQNKNLSIEPPTDKELLDFAFRFKSELLLWGSPKVIKTYLVFEDIKSVPSGDILKATNALYLAIRSDIGLSNYGLNNHELVKIFITDRKEFDKVN